MEKSVANPEPAKVLARVSECMRRLMEAGLPFNALQLPIDDPEMRKRLVRFWQSGGYEAPAAQRIARTIMGTNFFGIEEAIWHFGVNPTKAQLAALAEVPFTEAVLQECKDTHILVAVFPLSILDIRKRVGRKLFFFHEDAWHNAEPLAKKRIIKSKWHLILKKPVSNSINKTWNEQQELLGDNDEVPELMIMVYTIIGRYLATGERLFKNIRARCADSAFDGGHVCVCDLVNDGLHVYNWRDDSHHNDLGLASSRMPAAA